MPLGVPELLLILVIVLVLFGAKRLPPIGRQLGGGLREFRDAVRRREDEDEDDPETPSPPELAAGSAVIPGAAGAIVGAPTAEDQDEPRRAAD